MRKVFFLAMVFGIFELGSAQDQIQKFEGTIYEVSEVEVQASYTGGMKEFHNLLSKNFKPPRVEGIYGKIVTSFVIERNGTISNIQILKDVGFGSDKEMIRVLEKSDLWIPAQKNGVTVRSRYEFPIKIETAY